jgi:hypothetical protein
MEIYVMHGMAVSQINAWLRLLLISKCLKCGRGTVFGWNDFGTFFMLPICLLILFLNDHLESWSKFLFSEFWFSTSMDIFQVPKICSILKGFIFIYSGRWITWCHLWRQGHKLESSKWKQISYHSQHSSLEVCRPWNLLCSQLSWISYACIVFRSYIFFGNSPRIEKQNDTLFFVILHSPTSCKYIMRWPMT